MHIINDTRIGFSSGIKTKEAGIEIQPRYKIQYPMKNRNKDVVNN